MTLELMETTNTLLTEISDSKMTERDVAQTYRLAMQSSCQTDWGKVNRAIVERWSKAALVRIKTTAQNGMCFSQITSRPVGEVMEKNAESNPINAQPDLLLDFAKGDYSTALVSYQRARDWVVETGLAFRQDVRGLILRPDHPQSPWWEKVAPFELLDDPNWIVRVQIFVPNQEVLSELKQFSFPEGTTLRDRNLEIVDLTAVPTPAEGKTEHPFDEPTYFGEDGEWFVVRGDITADEAARRLTDYDNKLTGEKREPIKPQELRLTQCFYTEVNAEGPIWRIFPRKSLPEKVMGTSQVWVFDNY